MEEREASVRRGDVLRDSVGVGLATAAYGISFGALAVAAGLDVWQTCFLSLVMFTGGSQFALVGSEMCIRDRAYPLPHLDSNQEPIG